MIRLALRTLPVFAVIIGFAMTLAAYMNFSGVRSAYLDLIHSRMAMMAEDIAKDIADCARTRHQAFRADDAFGCPRPSGGRGPADAVDRCGFGRR